MPIARVLAIFLYGTFAAVIAVTHFTEYIEDDSLGGFTCPPEYIDFVEENLGHLKQCLLKCSKASACYGVFRHAEDKRCVGCRDMILTNESAPLLTGTEYYKRPVLYKLVEKVMNWYDAKNYYEDLGGYIADIKTQDEQEFIENMGTIFKLKTGEPDQPLWKGVWVGATKLVNTEPFMWQDGTDVSDGYTNWQQTPGTSDDSCIVLDFNSWEWLDRRCTLTFHMSLCEFD